MSRVFTKAIHARRACARKQARLPAGRFGSELIGSIRTAARARVTPGFGRSRHTTADADAQQHEPAHPCRGRGTADIESGRGRREEER